MKVRVLVAAVAALLALSSGCGDADEPAAAGSGGGAPAAGSGGDIDLDAVDPCVLVSAEELRAFFGEPPGEQTPNGGGFIKGCALDDASGSSYVHVSVQQAPLGAKQQYDFDRSETKAPIDLSGVGEEAFGYHSDDEAGVEARHRGVLVHLVLLRYDDEKLDDPAAVLDKLTVLTKQAIARL